MEMILIQISRLAKLDSPNIEIVENSKDILQKLSDEDNSL